MLRSLIAAATGLAVLIGGFAWLRPESRCTSISPQSVVPEAGLPVQPGVAYRLAVAGERLEFVLPAQPEVRYLLVLGSLGNPQRAHSVELHAAPTHAPPRIDGVPLESWDRSDPSPGPTEINGTGLPTERPGSDSEGPSASAVEPSTFHLHVTDGPPDDPRHYARITAREISRGRRVSVLLDATHPITDRIARTAAEIVRLCEERVFPRTRQLLGPHVDVNGDGRLTILLTPWLGRLQGGRTSLGGLVRVGDFRSDLPAPFSNRCDLMFLNSAVTPGPQLHALLAHEYGHVVMFSRRATGGGVVAVVEDDWLAEGLAHVCEHLHRAGWTNLDHRVARYLESPQRFPLVIENYHQSGLWRDRGCRGATFLFLRWCVDQFGEAFLRRLIDGDDIGVRNIERCSGHAFEDLFRRWCLAVYWAGNAERLGAAFEATIPRFRSLTLRGPLGEHRLSGPRATAWCDRDRRRTIEVRGTAAAFLEIRCHSAQPRQFRIRATSGTRLQATLIRLPDAASELHAARPGRQHSRLTVTTVVP